MSSATHAKAVRLGLRLEAVSAAWMLFEAAIAIAAGVTARSVLLTAFGADSVIELISALLLLWRLDAERRAVSRARVEASETLAGWLSAVLLVLLSAYVLVFGLAGLALGIQPEGSPLGLAVAAAALVAMPLLAFGKRRVNMVLGSGALRADTAETLSCAYLAATTLAGVALNTALGWWWADYLGALVLLVWLAREARAALESARGRA